MRRPRASPAWPGNPPDPPVGPVADPHPVLILRILALLVAAAAGGAVLAWAFTGERKYLRFAWRVFQVALAVALVILGLMFFERVAVLV